MPLDYTYLNLDVLLDNKCENEKHDILKRAVYDRWKKTPENIIVNGLKYKVVKIGE